MLWRCFDNALTLLLAGFGCLDPSAKKPGEGLFGTVERQQVGVAFGQNSDVLPVAGAITQEVIDVVAVLNALRAAFPPKQLSDFE